MHFHCCVLVPARSCALFFPAVTSTCPPASQEYEYITRLRLGYMADIQPQPDQFTVLTTEVRARLIDCSSRALLQSEVLYLSGRSTVCI